MCASLTLNRDQLCQVESDVYVATDEDWSSACCLRTEILSTEVCRGEETRSLGERVRSKICDLFGNVSEWVQDVYFEAGFRQEGFADQGGSFDCAEPSLCKRVVRGASIESNIGVMRDIHSLNEDSIRIPIGSSRDRFGFGAQSSSYKIGFRLAKD